jgi:metallo-beta-lactamase family protein
VKIIEKLQMGTESVEVQEIAQFGDRMTASFEHMEIVLDFLGAADGVTGSKTLISYRNKHWLIDCGLFQGPKDIRERNRKTLFKTLPKLDGIILTHAHLDHSGYLPKIFKEGYRGAIHCSKGTADLCRILLRDAAFLEEESARFANETKYSNHSPAIPLFTQEDAELAIDHLDPIDRGEWKDIMPGVRFRFLRAGHIIGASIVQLEFKENGRQKIFTFSGDVGHNRSFVLKGPEEGIETDILILESTYGDRQHPKDDVLEAFSKIYKRTIERGGILVIPAFAVGRAQEVTYMIRLLEDQDRIPVVPVILDSPMAIAAMEICLNHQEDRVSSSGSVDGEEFKPKLFETSTTKDESIYTCMREGPMVVISASGMLSGGRILHHLKRRIVDERNTTLFCGYQPEGTKGRFLQEKGKEVGEIRIHHEVFPVNAEIATIDHLSAHGDQEDLLNWVSRMRRLPKTVMLNHGDPAAQAAMAALIKERFGIKTLIANDNRRWSVTL